MTQATRLLRPTPDLLPGYVAALRRGWSPDNVRGAVAAREILDRIASDPDLFFLTTHGSQRPRLPGVMRWIWDAHDPGPGGFAGSIGLRWMADHAALPSWVLGHIGYAVPEWQRGRGHATRALGRLLQEARGFGLPFVDLTTDPDNTASQRVMVANGAVLVERFDKGEVYGHQPGLRYRIALI